MKLNYLAPLTCTALLLVGATAYAQSESNSSTDQSTTSTVTTTTNSSSERAGGTREDFNRMDVKNRGYLTYHEVKSDKWLKRNFARCNLKADGRMSFDEFSNCHE
jgi:hypothetical protein